MEGKNVIKTIHAAYEDPRTVARYSSEMGLWRSEEFLIKQFIPKKGMILDLGCGTGRTSIPLAMMGFHVTGMDISLSMVMIAGQEAFRRELKIDFLQMDANALACAGGSFDGVLFSFNGMDQMPGLKGKLQVFRQIFRVLKPGGTFIFSVHRIWSPFHLRALIRSSINLSLGKIAGFKTLEKEWGELYNIKTTLLEERYMHFLTSKKWKSTLHEAGFDAIHHYSRSQLEYHWFIRRIRMMPSSWNYSLFVARKLA
jgi:SAM-dependent methyltransferase